MINVIYLIITLIIITEIIYFLLLNGEKEIKEELEYYSSKLYAIIGTLMYYAITGVITVVVMDMKIMEGRSFILTNILIMLIIVPSIIGVVYLYFKINKYFGMKFKPIKNEKPQNIKRRKSNK